MSTLTKVLCESARKIEDAALVERVLQSARLTHHLMPPAGWLNDPNGLCYFKGRYHVFFQYNPFEATGGLKFWGHYSSADMLEWKYEGVALYPDSVMDCHGAYSGSALVEGDKLHLFFTGNVKEEDGVYTVSVQVEPSNVFQTLQQSSTEVSNEKIKQGLDGNDPEVFAAVLTESVQKSLEKNRYGKAVTVNVSVEKDNSGKYGLLDTEMNKLEAAMFPTE